jgi:hypothetical protein
MSSDATDLAPYEARLVELWERMVRTIGIHTVNVLVERAVWEASHKHPELALIEVTDTGLALDELNKKLAGRPEGEVSDAFGDLTSELMMVLARLIGKEMAQNVAKELQMKLDLENRAAVGRQIPT